MPLFPTNLVRPVTPQFIGAAILPTAAPTAVASASSSYGLVQEAGVARGDSVVSMLPLGGKGIGPVHSVVTRDEIIGGGSGGDGIGGEGTEGKTICPIQKVPVAVLETAWDVFGFTPNWDQVSPSQMWKELSVKGVSVLAVDGRHYLLRLGDDNSKCVSAVDRLDRPLPKGPKPRFAAAESLHYYPEQGLLFDGGRSVGVEIVLTSDDAVALKPVDGPNEGKLYVFSMEAHGTELVSYKILGQRLAITGAGVLPTMEVEDNDDGQWEDLVRQRLDEGGERFAIDRNINGVGLVPKAYFFSERRGFATDEFGVAYKAGIKRIQGTNHYLVEAKSGLPPWHLNNAGRPASVPVVQKVSDGRLSDGSPRIVFTKSDLTKTQYRVGDDIVAIYSYGRSGRGGLQFYREEKTEGGGWRYSLVRNAGELSGFTGSAMLSDNLPLAGIPERVERRLENAMSSVGTPRRSDVPMNHFCFYIDSAGQSFYIPVFVERLEPQRNRLLRKWAQWFPPAKITDEHYRQLGRLISLTPVSIRVSDFEF